METKEFKNYGIILGESSPTTFAGGTIPHEVRNPLGTWESFVPEGEWQVSDNGDSMSCVTFSALNSIETQEKFLTGNQVNYSDRWIAKMSGTTRNGNYLDKVAETIRTYGLVLESSYPTPKEFTWDEYHQEIPESLLSQLKAEGQEWLTKWDVKYEKAGIDKKSLQFQLKQSPVQVVIPGHAVENILSDSKTDIIFDSYNPFIKDIPPYYSKIISAMKIVLYKKEQALDPDMLFLDLKFGDTGKQVLKLKRALTRLGWMSADGDVYDNDLVRTVYNYSLANLDRTGWSWWWHFLYYRGKVVNATLRDNINNNLIASKR